MSESAVIRPVAHIRTDFPEKFGIPRQSGLVKSLRGRVVFEPEFRVREALRGIEGFSYLWLIWQFSENTDVPWRPTVRPPKLGGNTRMGVFATRSPFRPNSLALSCVKLEGVDWDSPDAPALLVSGIDMLDGTPVFDVKPYVPSADIRDDAKEGFTRLTGGHILDVSFAGGLLEKVPEEKREALVGVLKNDPRPGYADDPEKKYGLSFGGFDVGFTVDSGRLLVFRVDER